MDAETRKEQSRNSSAPWGRVLAPPQAMHIAISLRCFADTEIPTWWDMLTACCPQAWRPQTSRNQEVDHADFKLPPHHQKNIHELITPSSLNHSYKTSHYPFQVLTHSFEDISPLCREGNGTPLQYSCLENPMDGRAWKAAVHGVSKSQTRLSNFTFTFHSHALEKEIATHSSVLAWRIPGTGEPGELPSMGSHRVGHD